MCVCVFSVCRFVLLNIHLAILHPPSPIPLALIYHLEKLHARAGHCHIIYRLPWDVLERAGWVPLSAMYENCLAQCINDIAS